MALIRISGYASVFNKVDLSGDVVLPGAFNHPRPNEVKMLYSHYNNKVIGKWESIHEDDYGLRVEGLIGLFGGTVSEHVFSVRTLIDTNSLGGLSIGFIAREWEGKAYDGRSWSVDRSGRILKHIELLEISLVHTPMMPHATFTATRID